ncbi:MAG: hypothetical protein WBV96_11785, partial [Polyangia bacterium]
GLHSRQFLSSSDVGEWDRSLPERCVRHHVQRWLSSLRRNLCSEHQRQHLWQCLRPLSCGAGERKRHLHRHSPHLRIQLQCRLPPLRQQYLRGESQYRRELVREQLHRLPGSGQRHGHLRRENLRRLVQQRLSPVRHHLHCEQQRQWVWRLVHGVSVPGP